MSSPAPAPRPPVRQRGNPSLGDMVRSVVVLGVIVLIIVLGGKALYGRSGDVGAPVDYRTTVKEVRKAATYPVAAPTPLPKGWRATSTTYEPGSKGRWHLGVLTGDDEYIGLEQTPIGIAATVDAYASKTKQRGTTTIDGTTWQVRAGGGDTTLVRRADGVTTLVTGTASRAQLEAYAGSLRLR